MSREISIAISAKDNFTDAVTKMRNAGVHFNKNIEEMQAQLKALNSNRATLKLDTDGARKNLQALQKEISEAKKISKDGIVSEDLLKKLDAANEEYERMRQNMSILDKSARETEKSLSAASGVFSKLESRATSGSKGGIMESAVGGLIAAGAGKFLGDLAAQAAGAYVGSAFGDAGSDYFSSMLSGAITGAAIGSVIPGIGTAIGAAVGTGLGAVSGATQTFQKWDESFKSTRGEMISAQQSRAQSDLQAGIGIAGQRETDQIAFSKLLGGEGEAKQYLDWVKDTANATPFQYDDLKSMSKVLATYKFSTGEMQDALLKIGDAGASLGMSSQDMGMVATGLGRMKSSGKTSLEYINLLQERGIDAIGMLGDFYGMDNGGVYDAISRGELDGGRSTAIILKYLEAYAGAMDEQSKTYLGRTSTVEGLEQERQVSRGEGYNKERLKGLEDQEEYLQNNQEKISEAEKLIGQWEASLDNERDAIRRTHEEEAYDRIKQDGLTGAEAGRVLAEARITAEAEYNATDGAQLKLESDLLLTENVTSMLSENPRFWNANYQLGQAASKGIKAGVMDSMTLDSDSLYGEFSYDKAVSGEYGFGNAYGLSYVPRDNYPAKLHEGERVLTASEARAYKSGGGVNITINTGDLVVREDADVDRIAAELARKLREAQMIS